MSFLHFVSQFHPRTLAPPSPPTPQLGHNPATAQHAVMKSSKQHHEHAFFQRRPTNIMPQQQLDDSGRSDDFLRNSSFSTNTYPTICTTITDPIHLLASTSESLSRTHNMSTIHPFDPSAATLAIDDGWRSSRPQQQSQSHIFLPPQDKTTATISPPAFLLPLGLVHAACLAIQPPPPPPVVVALTRFPTLESIEERSLTLSTPFEDYYLICSLQQERLRNCRVLESRRLLLQQHQSGPISSKTEQADDTTDSIVLACPEDRGMLNEHLVYLRQHLEFFRATWDDIMSHTRGRNKDITIRQVGLRCIHCRHVPVSQRRRGSTYFPSAMIGIYQAAQNISSLHLQTGACAQVPQDVQRTLLTTRATKPASSCAGKAYWAESARMLGLIDTEQDGIRFAADGARHSKPANYFRAWGDTTSPHHE